jgi:hypothetical protein
MRIAAFEIPEPVPELHEPHALVMLRPWVDVGSVGSLTLRRLQRHFGAKELGKLDRPGTFFDFTRYRPTTRIVDGRRETTFPNTTVYYAQPAVGPELLFMHMLEPHAHAEDYIESIIELLRHFKVQVYCRVGAMYDSVPHTRPIVVTGNPGTLQPRPGMVSPHVQQAQSQYQGPTSIMNTVTDTATQLGITTVNFMAHLPHYAQMEEDFAATARMLEVLAAYYELPASLMPTRRGQEQYRHLNAAVQQNSELKTLITQLEAHYDSTYGDTPRGGSEQKPTTELSPEIERFLRGLDPGQQGPPPA